MTPVAKVIATFGSVRKTQAATGIPASTIQSWKDAGYVPARHQATVLEAAKRLRKRLTAADLINGHGKRD
jgi:hypothetical protein